MRINQKLEVKAQNKQRRSNCWPRQLSAAPWRKVRHSSNQECLQVERKEQASVIKLMTKPEWSNTNWRSTTIGAPANLKQMWMKGITWPVMRSSISIQNLWQRQTSWCRRCPSPLRPSQDSSNPRWEFHKTPLKIRLVFSLRKENNSFQRNQRDR